MNITFPDGSVKQFEQGVTPLQIAESISPRLALMKVGWNYLLQLMVKNGIYRARFVTMAR